VASVVVVAPAVYRLADDHEALVGAPDVRPVGDDRGSPISSARSPTDSRRRS
jgi:hypothetical protein